MELDFTKQAEVLRRFNPDVYRYLNDKRITSLAGGYSDPFYADLMKFLTEESMADYGPFINLGITRSIYVYNTTQAKFYKLTLDDDFLRYVCESFYIKSIQIMGINESVRFNRTDSRKVDFGDPYAIYVNALNRYTDKPSEKYIPTMVNVYSADKFLNDFQTLSENFFKHADPKMLFNKDDLINEQIRVVNRLREFCANYETSFITGLEEMSAYDYYYTRKADPLNPIAYREDVSSYREDDDE